jgi:hypothetical protein
MSEKLDRANQAVRDQWAKLDDAIARGLRGAPLVRIDQKLRRLQDEADRISDEEEVRVR